MFGHHKTWGQKTPILKVIWMIMDSLTRVGSPCVTPPTYTLAPAYLNLS